MVITRHIAFQTKLLFTPIYSANRSFGTEQFYALMKTFARYRQASKPIFMMIKKIRQKKKKIENRQTLCLSNLS